MCVTLRKVFTLSLNLTVRNTNNQSADLTASKNLLKVMGYALINFMGANFHCLEKQPFVFCIEWSGYHLQSTV